MTKPSQSRRYSSLQTTASSTACCAEWLASARRGLQRKRGVTTCWLFIAAVDTKSCLLPDLASGLLALKCCILKLQFASDTGGPNINESNDSPPLTKPAGDTPSAFIDSGKCGRIGGDWLLFFSRGGSTSSRCFTGSTERASSQVVGFGNHTTNTQSHPSAAAAESSPTWLPSLCVPCPSTPRACSHKSQASFRTSQLHVGPTFSAGS